MIDTDHDLRPWVPEGAREFQVGDRVRVRLSGECRASWMSYSFITNLPTGRKAHVNLEDGRVGEIVNRPYGRPIAQADHPHLVWYDEPFLTEGAVMVGGSYAPSELELITPAESTPTRTERPPGTRFAHESTPNTTRAREAVDGVREGG